MPFAEPAPELTIWLKRMSAGDAEAAEYVATIVYSELKRIAAAMMSRESRNHSLQPTLIVNEAFLQLLRGQPIDWQDRQHFFHLTARMMRRIVVDHFRREQAEKRPQRQLQVELQDTIAFDDSRREEALMLNDALDLFEKVDVRAARVVELRYFGGLTVDQTAEVLRVTDRTVKRDWKMAQWWLRRYIETGESAAK